MVLIPCSEPRVVDSSATILASCHGCRVPHTPVPHWTHVGALAFVTPRQLPQPSELGSVPYPSPSARSFIISSSRPSLTSLHSRTFPKSPSFCLLLGPQISTLNPNSPYLAAAHLNHSDQKIIKRLAEEYSSGAIDLECFIGGVVALAGRDAVVCSFDLSNYGVEVSGLL